MFGLTEADLGKVLLGCADGPASFNCELTQRGGRVVSVDPLYQFSCAQIERRIRATSVEVIEKVRQNQQEFVWKMISSPEELAQIRLEAMEQFLVDFEQGLAAGRYLNVALPELPFASDSFDLALCSHFLFLYAAQFDLDFHLHAMGEMLRVASEVRIFPVLELGSRPSRHLLPVMSALEKVGFDVSLQVVAYEFQRGGNQMLRVKRLPG